MKNRLEEVVAIAWAMGSQARPLASPFGLAYRPSRLPWQDTATTPLTKPTSSPILGSERISIGQPYIRQEPFARRKALGYRHDKSHSQQIETASGYAYGA